MLTRSAPMKRTGFKSRAPQAQNSDPDRLRSMPTVAPGAFRAPEPVASAPAARVEKAVPVRNEAYRRLVAAMPCVICGMVGYGQAAHGSAGKGMGIKASDLELFCLCADRPGVRGCHSLLDQGALFTKAVRRELEPVWAADTQRRIQAMGLWPKNMQKPAL
jgi:hypothetical protein